MTRRSSRRIVALLVAFAALGCGRADDRVVVYCAQDEDFARTIFADFEAATGVTVVAQFDTEANKSVGLATALELERDRPRCDVHWNNEILATIRLATAGVYRSYRSPGAEGFPAWTAAPDGTWQAFAARARVLVVNRDLLGAGSPPRSIFDLADPKWRGQVAIAKPQFGTTATHAACLTQLLGLDESRAYFESLDRNGVRVLAGNKHVARAVADGEILMGLTDTDDALIEIRAGRPVTMLFLDATPDPARPGLGTLFIPNTVAIVSGGPNPKSAERLVDYLLSREVEARLAAGGGFQIPLHPAVAAELPAELRRPSEVQAMTVDFTAAATQFEPTQTFLRPLFAR